MTPIAAKLAGPDIAPPRAERVQAPVAAVAPSMPSVVVASLAIHALLALVLVRLPMPACDLRGLETTWVSFDLAPLPAPAPEIAPEPEVTPPPLPTAPEPERIVHRERPQVAPTPDEVVPPEPVVNAPPSLEEAFAEPPPPAASLMAEGTGSAFAVAPGELGGMAGGTPGGHGTSLVSSVRPTPRVDPGPSEADRRRARRGYVHTVEELVRTHTRYPRAAARDGLQGRVELALRIGSDGRVLAIRLASSSGHGVLDDAALDAAREIDRVPAPPLLAALTTTDEVRVGVVYMVR